MTTKVLALGILASATWAQQPATNVKFDVASIKTGNPNAVPSTDYPDLNSLLIENQTLKSILAFAYSVDPDRIESGPDWMESAKFTIEARLASGQPGSLIPQALQNLRQALQNLLADRFQVQIHREARMKPAFALIQATGGNKLKQASPDEPGRDLFTRSSFAYGTWEIRGVGVSISRLIAKLPADAPVIDRTGLEGEFNFTLKFAHYLDPAGDTRPDLFQAIQDQLGLKLEPMEAPAEVLVVDRAEKPPEN